MGRAGLPQPATTAMEQAKKDASMNIRNATDNDLANIVAIKNKYIERGFNGIFEKNPLTTDSQKQWFSTFKTFGPHQLLIAENSGTILGFCGSMQYRDHPVFDRTVETTIYVDPDTVAKGVGRSLYESLFSRLEGLNLHRALVGIALPNPASIALHKKFGFEEIGVFDEYAFFDGKPISSVWMQKKL